MTQIPEIHVYANGKEDKELSEKLSKKIFQASVICNETRLKILTALLISDVLEKEAQEKKVK
jgi:hypothetical protein